LHRGFDYLDQPPDGDNRAITTLNRPYEGYIVSRVSRHDFYEAGRLTHDTSTDEETNQENDVGDKISTSNNTPSPSVPTRARQLRVRQAKPRTAV
jgi:hypothetical protein